MAPLSSRGRLGLLVLLALALALGLASLDQWHGDGPDFAQYLHHTRNLLQGTPYGQGQYHSHPIKNYPPGYPLMLTPVMALAGMNLVWYKAFNLVIWLGLCLIVFFMARRRLEPLLAWLLLAWLLFSPWAFFFKGKIVSDISFAFFALAGLALFERSQREPGSHPGLVAGALALMAWAMLVRTVGFALLGGMGLYYLAVRRDIKAALLPGLVMVAVVAVQWFSGTSTGGYLHTFPPREVCLHRIAWGWAYYLAQMANFFTGGLFNLLKNSPHILLIQVAVTTPAMALAAWGLRLDLARRGLGAEHLCAGLYLLVVMVYPYWEGVRYVLPVAVLMLVYLVWGLADLTRRLTLSRPGRGVRLAAGVLALALLVNLAGIAMVWQRQDDYLYSPHMKQLAAWLQANTTPQDHYLTRLPRVVALFSSRTGVMMNEKLPLADWLKKAAQVGTRFFIFRQERDQGLIAAARARADLAQVFANPYYVVFALKSPATGAGTQGDQSR